MSSVATTSTKGLLSARTSLIGEQSQRQERIAAQGMHRGTYDTNPRSGRQASSQVPSEARASFQEVPGW
jgi:hypothetical protein